MTNRKKFIDYVVNGGEKPICSLQIGTGAGYDTKLAGKEWITETTLDDTISVCERYEMLPLYNCGVDILMPAELGWKLTGSSANENTRTWDYEIETPYGALEMTNVEQKHKGVFRTKDSVNGAEDLDKFEWLLDRILEGKYEKLTETLAGAVKHIGERGAISFQWGMQPYELFGYPNTVNTMFLALDEEARFRKLMDKCLAISKRIVRAVADAGGDFCFLGGPAAEMVNFDIYDRFMVPYGKSISDETHRAGLLIYSHVCSPVEPFLSKGYFNQLGIDLFETLSMPPVGNVASIEDAFQKLDPMMCTRGNVGLDQLITGTPEDVARDVLHILETAVKTGRKHIVGASDYLMTECKPENVAAVCDTVAKFRKNG